MSGNAQAKVKTKLTDERQEKLVTVQADLQFLGAKEEVKTKMLTMLMR